MLDAVVLVGVRCSLLCKLLLRVMEGILVPVGVAVSSLLLMEFVEVIQTLVLRLTLRVANTAANRRLFSPLRWRVMRSRSMVLTRVLKWSLTLTRALDWPLPCVLKSRRCLVLVLLMILIILPLVDVDHIGQMQLLGLILDNEFLIDILFLMLLEIM